MALPHKELMFQQFGPQCLEPALFLQYTHGLRFELGGRGTHIERFLRAFERVWQLVQDTFMTDLSIYVYLHLWDAHASGTNLQKHRRQLQASAIALPSVYDYWVDIERDEEEESNTIYNHWYAFQEPRDSATIKGVVWAVCGQEIGIQPTAYVSAFFVNPDATIIVHPYDDRGCDVVAISKEVLLPLYAQHVTWLLPDNLDAMKAHFGEQA